MTIGELARRASVHVQTVRYYERMKLLPAPHRWPDSGYRDFDHEALQRLRFIRSAQELGFTLREIKALIEFCILPRESCAEVLALLRAKQKDVSAQIARLQQLRRGLHRLLAACRRRRGNAICPALSALAEFSQKENGTKKFVVFDR